MNISPWPLNIPLPSPEKIAEYETLADKFERGDFETRPLTGVERKKMERLQADPVTVSIIRRKPEEFQVEMRCRCGVEDKFDHTAPKPWIDRRNKFRQGHREHGNG
jgi:hypothetical protein